MTRSTVSLTMALALLVGCGSSDESSFHSSSCFTEDLSCGRTHCATRETCDARSCKIEEGYDNDFDYFYKSKCTDTVTVTTVETPLDGIGIRTTTVRQSITECFYKEEFDNGDDFKVTDECTESTDTEVTRETCERDRDCPSCAPICTPTE
jgi:hypothetical protein